MESRTLWLTAAVLASAFAGLGYIFYVIAKYKRLLRRESAATSSQAQPVRTREAIPDRRGMGAQSDFISQTFVPSQAHTAEQIRMARSLIALGSEPAEAAARIGIPIELLHES